MLKHKPMTPPDPEQSTSDTGQTKDDQGALPARDERAEAKKPNLPDEDSGQSRTGLPDLGAFASGTLDPQFGQDHGKGGGQQGAGC